MNSEITELITRLKLTGNDRKALLDVISVEVSGYKVTGSVSVSIEQTQKDMGWSKGRSYHFLILGVKDVAQSFAILEYFRQYDSADILVITGDGRTRRLLVATDPMPESDLDARFTVYRLPILARPEK